MNTPPRTLIQTSRTCAVGLFLIAISGRSLGWDQYKTATERDNWKLNNDTFSNSLTTDGRVGEPGAEGAAVGAAVNRMIHEQRSKDVNEAERQYNERQNCLYCPSK